jgi:crotonobetainyl-CoA:carnitine CoA-transferase CaiB-like acyl-CoA transferase
MTTLEDLRILDLSDSAGGAYCASIFAAYGADVIAVEPPGGSPLRARSDWECLAAGKLSVTLDIRAPSGRAIFRKMVEGANLVVETFPAGTMEALGLAFGDLHGIKRRIILASVAPGDEATAYLAGLSAFTASAIAVHNADAYEVPQHIEISGQECAAFASAVTGAVDSPSPGVALFEMSDVERAILPSASPGEHTVPFLREDLGLGTQDVLWLRAAGAI